MHIIKLHSSDCKSVLEEASRDHKSKVGTIDESRTHLNYSLAPEANRVTDSNSIKERIKALGVTRKIRDDAVLSCSCIITLPTDYKGDTEAFMRSAYKALIETLCKGNEDRVIQAEVHMDEKTPHMHFAFIPITEKVNKKGKPTIALDAKNLLNKTFMREFHPLTEKLISEDLKMPVKLYDEEKCKERTEKHAKGDFSADYEDIEEFKARKSKEEAKKKLEDKLEDITLTIGGKELELCEISGILEEKDKEIAEKDKIIAEKTAENEKILKEKEALVSDLNSIKEKLTQKALERDEVDKNTLKAKQALLEAENALSTKKKELDALDKLKESLESMITDTVNRFYKALKAINKALDMFCENKKLSEKELQRYDKAIFKQISYTEKGKSLIEKSLEAVKDKDTSTVIDTNNALNTLIDDMEEDEDLDL